MKIELENLSVGNKVWVGCDSGFCDDGIEIVRKTTIRFCDITGRPYDVIHTDTGSFDSRTGIALEPPLAYYLMPCEQNEEFAS